MQVIGNLLMYLCRKNYWNIESFDKATAKNKAVQIFCLAWQWSPF